MTGPRKFTARPVAVEAMPYDGTPESFDRIWDWMDGYDPKSPMQGYSGDEDSPGPFGIKTLEGVMYASPGDWIIKGTKGEFYACKPDVFAVKYEESDR